MKINSNSTAIRTNNYLLRSENALQGSISKLSSGYKLNHSEDNPSGYAISSVMRAQIEGLKRATNNANDGISVIETAEGAVAEMQNMIQRMKQLATQASNETNTTADREAIQEEVTALCSEITRLATQTDFNTQKLLDGNYEYKGYTSEKGIKVMSYSDETRVGKYDLSLIKNADNSISLGGVDMAKLAINPEISYENEYVTIKSNDGTDIRLKLTEFDTMPVGTDIPFELDITGIGALRLQIGANEGQVLEMNFPEISLEKMGLKGIDCTTVRGAKNALDQVDEALDYTSRVRSKFGAYQNRLEHAIASLDVTSENMNAAYSQIVDVDMAEEMSEYTKLQVLQQAGTSMLAQANEFPQQALQLLQ